MLEGVLNVSFTCPVCAYPDLKSPPENFSICPSCGTEFGFDDAGNSHEELRRQWIAEGLHWFNDMVPQPLDWEPWKQLIDGGYATSASSSYASTVNANDLNVSNDWTPPPFRVKSSAPGATKAERELRRA